MTSNLSSDDLGLDLEDEEPLDVLDLPQIYTKPSARSLLDTLSLLALEPRSWEGTPPLTGSNTPISTSGASTPRLPVKRRVKADGVPQYLTRIVSSPLAWLKTDEDREQIWDTAAVRLSERSGRTGMGAISRKFRIPTTTESTNADSSLETVIASGKEQDTAVEIEIHEPPMTSDNLGLKTWASSYVLARKWHALRDDLPLSQHGGANEDRILELGAGTGLVGIAAAVVLGTTVILTDLPEIVPNLERNANSNKLIVKAKKGSTQTAVLDWTKPADVVFSDQDHQGLDQRQSAEPASAVSDISTGEGGQGLSVPVIVAADPIYSTDHPRLLAQAVAFHLHRAASSRVVVTIPIREAYAAERADFRKQMQVVGLEMVQEDTDIGYDDWTEGSGEELVEVECWMSVWAWKTSVIEGGGS